MPQDGTDDTDHETWEQSPGTPRWLILGAAIVIALAVGAAGGAIFGHRQGRSAYTGVLAEAHAHAESANNKLKAIEANLSSATAELEKTKEHLKAAIRDRDALLAATTKREEVANAQQKASSAPTVEYKELRSSVKFGRKWRAIVVPKGINREQLVELTRELHKSDSTSSFRFFDDDAKYEEFRLHDENYPSPQYPSPEGWVRKHYIGLLNKIGDRGGHRWELWAMDGGIHFLPSGAQSQTIAVIE